MTKVYFEVQTLISGDWENVWSCDGAPVLFDDRRDAERDLAEYFEAMEGASMDYDESNYRIEKVIA